MKHHRTQWIRRTFLGGLGVGGSGALLGLSRRPASAQGTFTLVDSESVPGPGDNMVVVERSGPFVDGGQPVPHGPNNTIVATISLTTNRAISHRVENDSTLTTIGSTTTGSGPRGIALARHGQFAVTANSDSDDLSVLSISDSGVLAEIARYPSGGASPYDVAVGWDDLVLVANRDSDSVALFSMDRRGGMHQIDSQNVGGVEPHIVAIGPSGVVAVANNASNDLTIFDLDRNGHMSLLDAAFSVGNSPKALAVGGRELFVATRSTTPGVEDRIQAYRPGPRGGFEAAGSTDAGIFLTGLAATEDTVLAVTVNAAGRDEIRAYAREYTDLSLHATLETGGPPPSFKSLSAARGRDEIVRVFVAEFQSGRLRSIAYQPG